MKIIGLATVRIGHLLLPGNFRAIVEEVKTAPLMTSRKHVGILHEPIVRKADNRLLAGRRRVAARVVDGHEDVLVKEIECDDEEAVLIELAENADREHDHKKQARLSATLTELFEKRVANEPIGMKLPGVRGRPRSQRKMARELAADVVGVRSETLRMREYRANKRKEKEAGGEAEVEGPPIRTIGMSLQERFLNDVADVQRALDRAAFKVSLSLGELTRLSMSPLPHHKDRIDRVRDELQSFAEALRSMRPASLCPSCKGIDAVQSECAGCRTIGYITEAQVAQIPAELWSEKEPVVLFRGYKRPLAEFAEEPKKEEDPFGFGELG